METKKLKRNSPLQLAIQMGLKISWMPYNAPATSAHDFDQEAVAEMARDKIEEINDNLIKLRTGFEAMKRRIPMAGVLFEVFYDMWQGMIDDWGQYQKRFEYYLPMANDNKSKMIDIDRIKQEVKIATLMPSQPVMRTPGREFYKSPFRDEKQASFCVYLGSNSWYDFGSNEGGSNIDLIMKLNNCDFKTAIKQLN